MHLYLVGLLIFIETFWSAAFQFKKMFLLLNHWYSIQRYLSYSLHQITINLYFWSLFLLSICSIALFVILFFLFLLILGEFLKTVLCTANVVFLHYWLFSYFLCIKTLFIRYLIVTLSAYLMRFPVYNSLSAALVISLHCLWFSCHRQNKTNV